MATLRQSDLFAFDCHSVCAKHDLLLCIVGDVVYTIQQSDTKAKQLCLPQCNAAECTILSS